jgi:transposase-like protein
MRDNLNTYAGNPYPAQVFSHSVGLYYRLSLSFRDIKELLATRQPKTRERPYTN